MYPRANERERERERFTLSIYVKYSLECSMLSYVEWKPCFYITKVTINHLVNRFVKCYAMAGNYIFNIHHALNLLGFICYLQMFPGGVFLKIFYVYTCDIKYIICYLLYSLNQQDDMGSKFPLSYLRWWQKMPKEVILNGLICADLSRSFICLFNWQFACNSGSGAYSSSETILFLYLYLSETHASASVCCQIIILKEKCR